jgi:hypothetical protein
MKKILGAILFTILAVEGLTVLAQQKSLSSSLNIAAFPQVGQNAQQQSKDEAACYDWAVKNTGTDPFELQKKAAQQQQQTAQAAGQAQAAGEGAGVKGAARGAAGGALIGAVAGDAGTGAAIGAVTGAVVGRGRKRQAEAQAQQVQAQGAQVQQATAAQMTSFKKAFCACMEGKKYIAKY